MTDKNPKKIVNLTSVHEDLTTELMVEKSPRISVQEAWALEVFDNDKWDTRAIYDYERNAVKDAKDLTEVMGIPHRVKHVVEFKVSSVIFVTEASEGETGES